MCDGTKTFPWKKDTTSSCSPVAGMRMVCDLSELTLREAVHVIAKWEPHLYANGWHHGEPHQHKLSYSQMTSMATKADKDKFSKAQRDMKYECTLMWDPSVLQALEIDVTYLETGKALTKLAVTTTASYKAFDLYVELKQESTIRSGAWLAIYTAIVPRLSAL
eukprot:PhF_6_TR35214/c1_g1_i1/m.51272